MTKSWNDQQIIAGYGSYSKPFSIPVDYNNCNVLNYYNLLFADFVDSSIQISASTINPNYTLKARIVVNEQEIVGNIQVLGFSTKNDVDYSFNLTFYANEKDLLKRLDSVERRMLNDMTITDFDCKFNKENVINTWSADKPFVYVPLIGTKKEINYRDLKGANNINPYVYQKDGDLSKVLQTTTGITMEELKPSYNFKALMDNIYDDYGLTFVHSTGVTAFLENLYVMINPKPDNKTDESDLTYIFTKADENLLKSNIVDGRGNTVNRSFNVLQLTPGQNTTTGIIGGNTDTTSWNNITIIQILMVIII